MVRPLKQPDYSTKGKNVVDNYMHDPEEKQKKVISNNIVVSFRCESLIR